MLREIGPYSSPFMTRHFLSSYSLAVEVSCTVPITTLRCSSLVLLAVGFGSPCESSLVPSLLLVPAGIGGIVPQCFGGWVLSEFVSRRTFHCNHDQLCEKQCPSWCPLLIQETPCIVPICHPAHTSVEYAKLDLLNTLALSLTNSAAAKPFYHPMTPPASKIPFCLNNDSNNNKKYSKVRLIRCCLPQQDAKGLMYPKMSIITQNDENYLSLRAPPWKGASLFHLMLFHRLIRQEVPLETRPMNGHHGPFPCRILNHLRTL